MSFLVGTQEAFTHGILLEFTSLDDVLNEFGQVTGMVD